MGRPDSAPTPNQTHTLLDFRDTLHRQGGDAAVENALQALFVEFVLGQAGTESPEEELDEGGDRSRGFDWLGQLRGLTRTGFLSTVPEEARSTLLGGTLFAYDSEATPVASDEVFRATLTGSIGGDSSRGLEATGPIPSLSDLLDSLDSPGREGDVSFANDEVAELAMALRPLTRGRSQDAGGDGVRAPGFRTMALLENNLSSNTRQNQDSSPRRHAGTLTAETVDESRISSEPPVTTGHHRVAPGLRLSATLFPDETPATAGALGTTSAADRHFEALDMNATAHTVMADETMSPQAFTGGLDGMDGGLIGMLRQLAFESTAEMEDGLARTAQRVRQLGAVLAGQRLSDVEIEALPKVRFDSTEEQTCAICLEPYQKGEMLTALSCNHYFHVECLGRWCQRSTKCPLCRASV